MTPASSQDITQLLRAWSQGDSSALEKLTPLVYKKLHRLAHRYMGFESPGHTLKTTALVNEACLRLVSNQATRQNRAHFFAISAQLMQQILVDLARSRHQLKRGGKVQGVSLDEAIVSSRNRMRTWSRWMMHSRLWRPSIRARARSWSCALWRAECGRDSRSAAVLRDWRLRSCGCFEK
jgi:ECF sigma factor